MQMNRKSRNSTEEYDNRGQITPRHILGGVVLVVVLPTLATVWSDLTAGFASFPGFSKLVAALIASLFVLAIAFMILGIE